MIPQDQKSLMYEKDTGLRIQSGNHELNEGQITLGHTSPDDNTGKQMLSLQFLF